MKRVIGIDLGTTNSVVAYKDKFTGKGECIANRDGSYLTASAVCFLKENEIIIGNNARDCVVLYPQRTIMMFKRLMGICKEAITIDGKTYSPQQLSAMILRRLKEDTEDELGDETEQVVITVPAYFNANQRRATMEAAYEAGFTEVELLDEPVAALYAADSINDYAGKRVMVFNLGGGTLDEVVAEITEDSINELVINGDANCGGADWLSEFVRYIKETYLAGCDLDVEAEQELLNKTELAKIALSKKPEVTFSVVTDKGRREITVTLKEFEKCTEKLLDRVIKVLKETKEILDSKDIGNIDQIILCGGATRMLQVERAIREIYPGVEIYSKDRDQAVAKGAAVYADSLMNNKNCGKRNVCRVEDPKNATMNNMSKKLKRITSRSYGIIALVEDGVCQEKKISNMVMVNTALPVTVEKNFKTRYDDQQEVLLKVMENTSSDINVDLDAGEVVGECSLKINGNVPKGTAIAVAMYLNEDGTLVIRGSEATGNTEITASMETKALLDPDELAAESIDVETAYKNVI